MVLLSMAATIYATGAFHEDGLADMVDGLGGGWDKLRILEIMKDSRVGSYGVVALVLALLGKFVLLVALDATLVPFALLAGHAVSRFCSTVLLATIDYVREDLLAKAEFLNEKFRQIGKKQSDKARINWFMGELRKVALGNVNLTTLSNEI